MTCVLEPSYQVFWAARLCEGCDFVDLFVSFFAVFLTRFPQLYLDRFPGIDNLHSLFWYAFFPFFIPLSCTSSNDIVLDGAAEMLLYFSIDSLECIPRETPDSSSRFQDEAADALRSTFKKPSSPLLLSSGYWLSG